MPFLAFAFAIATLRLTAIRATGPVRLVKVLPALILGLTRVDEPRLAFAYLFYAAGDALLLSKGRGFLLGLVAFLLGHGLAIAGFLEGGRPAPAALAIGAVLVSGMVVALWPGLNRVMRVAVPLYGAALVALMWAATARSPLTAVGAGLFILSDALLGWNRFRRPLPGGDLPVLATYYVAIGLIAAGRA